MSDDARHTDPSDDDLLAAEYALGVLDGAQRQSVAARIARDAAFARRVADWEERLAGMNGGFAEVAPPPTVKAAIDQRLFEAGPSDESYAKLGWWQSLGFWRTLSGVALAFAVVLATITFFPDEMPAPDETFVASLGSDAGDVQFVALYDAADRRLRVTQLAGDRPPDRDFELWLIAGDQAPVSLGLIGAAGAEAPQVPDALRAAFDRGVTLAVSLEPQGGSPTGAPTGPVVAAGPAKKF